MKIMVEIILQSEYNAYCKDNTDRHHEMTHHSDSIDFDLSAWFFAAVQCICILSGGSGRMTKSSAEFSVSAQTAATCPATAGTAILQRINTNHHTTASSDSQAQTAKLRQPSSDNQVQTTGDQHHCSDIWSWQHERHHLLTLSCDIIPWHRILTKSRTLFSWHLSLT